MSKSRSDYVVYTPELIEKLKSMVEGLSRPEGVKKVTSYLKLAERRGREVYSKYVEGNFTANTKSNSIPSDLEKTPSKGAHIKMGQNAGEVDLVDSKPRSLEELIQICNVDLNIWEVEKYVINSWQMGRKDKKTSLTYSAGKVDGFIDDTGKIHKETLWQTKAWLRRKVEATALHQILEKFIEDAAKHAPINFKYETPPAGIYQKCCYVLNIQDLHLAKLAWSQETGNADWDIRIAEKTFCDTVNELIQKAPVERIEEVVLIIGSDMLQMDNDKSSTTAGTYVDSDTRLAKAYDVATKMLTGVIEQLATRFRVRCVVFGGNHDRTVSLFLGKYIEAWFRNHSNVIVDSSPRSRKYYGYGNTLIAFDHGDETKSKDLPLVIMRENQATISHYKYIECLTGHLHSEQSEDMKGIVVRVAPALCSPDKWHAGKGYIGTMRRSQGLLYNYQDGLECIIYSKALD